MKGDFTRDSFDRSNHFYRVMMQQGRVQLDADWNEQIAILLDRLQTMIDDVVGNYGGPIHHCGFAIFKAPGGAQPNFSIGIGRYYVNGLLAYNDDIAHYSDGDEPDLERGASYVVYLDAWEEYVSPAADGALAEPALGGIDTTGRTRVMWRVRARRTDTLPANADMAGLWRDTIVPELIGNPGRLEATVANVDDGGDSSVVARSGYHGAENQLYRVEIHDSGEAGTGATFKWSRDNGSIAFRIEAADGDGVTVATLGRDERTGLAPGDRVEISDDDDAGANRKARPLLEVIRADAASRKVFLRKMYSYKVSPSKHPLLRRWDQPSEPLPVLEGAGSEGWLALEDGISIRFSADPALKDGTPATYRRGDYWLIPARTVDGGSILWPQDGKVPKAIPPAGVAHAYAPLAGIAVDGSGLISFPKEFDYHIRFQPLADR